MCMLSLYGRLWPGKLESILKALLLILVCKIHPVYEVTSPEVNVDSKAVCKYREVLQFHPIQFTQVVNVHCDPLNQLPNSHCLPVAKEVFYKVTPTVQRGNKHAIPVEELVCFHNLLLSYIVSAHIVLLEKHHSFRLLRFCMKAGSSIFHVNYSIFLLEVGDISFLTLSCWLLCKFCGSSVTEHCMKLLLFLLGRTLLYILLAH